METVRGAELADLYASHARRLEHIVRSDVAASESVVEDACQFAWGRLVHHAGRVRSERALSWLATTAVREARRQHRRASREAPLESELERPGQLSPAQLVEQRDRLAAVRALPERQQRMVWLHAFGLSYGEIAVSQECTVRTVQRQLLRGKRALREASRQE